MQSISSLVSNGNRESGGDRVNIFIEESAKVIGHLHRQTTSNIVEIGRRLNAVKALLGHGDFGPWIRAECGFSERTATRYMNAAKAFDNKSDIVSEISISVVHVLSSPKTTEAARQTALDELKRGNIATAREVKAKIAGGDGKEPLVKSEESPTIVPRRLSAKVTNARKKLAQMLIAAKNGDLDNAIALTKTAQLPELHEAVESIKAQRLQEKAAFDARQLVFDL